MEEMFMQFLQSQQASKRNIENNVGQLATTLNSHSTCCLRNDKQVFRVEEGKECKAVELRNGKELSEPWNTVEAEKMKVDSRQESQKQKELVDVPIHVPEVTLAKYVSKIPYPQRC